MNSDQHDEVVRSIESYFGTVTVGAASVSVARAMKAIRARSPSLAASDDELARMISAAALQRGFSVMMDSRPEQKKD